MKKTLLLYGMVIGVVWLNPGFTLAADTSKSASTSTGSSEFDVLLGNDGEKVSDDISSLPPPPPPDAAGPAGPSAIDDMPPGVGLGRRGFPMGGRPSPGLGRGDGPRFLKERHEGAPAIRGRGLGGGRPWPQWGRRDPKELLNFLKEFEPELAAKLEAMQQDDPRTLRRKMGLIGRIYQPVMEQMERNPQMGKLSLQRIRLRLKTEQQLRQLQSDDADKAQIKSQLRGMVAELFDVILRQEAMRQDHIKDRLDARFGPGMPPPPSSPDDSDITEPGPGKQHNKWRHFQKRLEQHQKNVDLWRKNRDKIIDQHVEQMLDGIQPFPWGR